MKTVLLLFAATLCFHVAASSSLAAGPATSVTEQALITGRWDVITEVGQRAWGNIMFRDGHEFSTMNGPQGAWKVTGERTVELGGKYVLQFAPGLESFVVTERSGTKVATGTRKAATPPTASIIETRQKVMRTVPDPLNLTPTTSVPDQPPRITLPPENVPPPAKVAPTPIPVKAQAEIAPATKKPPVGVPADATFFNGKWYRVYLEGLPWKSAQDRCKILGGMLACVPDAPTQGFVANLAKGLNLWLGATDEETEGLWRWVDGNEMKYKAWARFEP